MVTIDWYLAPPVMASAADARKAHAELTRLFRAVLDANPGARVNVTFHAAGEAPRLSVNGAEREPVERLCDTLYRSSYFSSPHSGAALTSTATALAASGAETEA